MQERYFSISKQKDSSSSNDGLYSTGDLINRKDAVKIPWMESLDDDGRTRITKLYVQPTPQQLGDALIPEFIGKVDHLNFLYLQLPHFIALKENDLPPSLNHLMIGYEYGLEQYLADNLKSETVVFNQIKKLSFTGDQDDKGSNSLLSVPHMIFPSLEQLCCQVDKKGRMLEIIKSIGNLQHLELSRNHHHDIFRGIPESVAHLGIIGAGTKFPFANVASKKNIRTLWLNDIKAEIDCSIFRELPNLIEICFLNNAKISNIEALVECKSLKSIYGFNSDALREKKNEFIEMGLERLEIM